MKQAFIGLLCVFLPVLALRADPDPDGQMPPLDYVMARLWNNFSLQDASLKGILRTPIKQYPITLKTKGREIFMDIPGADLSVRVRLSSDVTSIEKGKKGGKNMRSLSSQEKSEIILDTDIRYEDLALSFLNWPEIREAGTDSIKTLPAYAYDAKPAGMNSRYASVRYWISSEFFALLRADAMDKDGKLVKRVQVNGVMQVGQAWVIKELQISTYTPGFTYAKSTTYLEIKEAKLNDPPR